MQLCSPTPEVIICLSVCLSVCLFVCLSVCSSVCLSVRLSVCLSVSVSLCFPIRLYICSSDTRDHHHQIVVIHADTILNTTLIQLHIFQTTLLLTLKPMVGGGGTVQAPFLCFLPFTHFFYATHTDKLLTFPNFCC